MKEFKAKSGAEIVINPASFEAAKNLWDAVQRVASSKNISLDVSSASGLIANLCMAVDSSPDFNFYLWPCLMRCTRNALKIEKSIFEDAEVRKEYYEIIVPCVDVNIRPFAESLSSELGARLAEMAASLPKSDQK